MTNPRHLSESVEHFTPDHIVEAARRALGGIDLDPASCAEADLTIKAASYLCAGGLDVNWNGRVFLNPPGGKVGKESSQKVWWKKLVREYESGRVTAAVFVSFSIELLQTSQVNPDGKTPHDFAICFPSRRIAYKKSGGLVGTSPPHSSMLVYLGPSIAQFVDAFRGIGRFMGPTS